MVMVLATVMQASEKVGEVVTWELIAEIDEVEFPSEILRV